MGYTAFENYRKSLIQDCERSGQKLDKNAKKWSTMSSFWKPETCGQTVLPDNSVLIGHKIGEKFKNSNATFWVIFKQCGAE